ncbi:MAG TPA: LytTR family DNA-binding domain-containing protein [Gammaproteobacteria bacterium]|nr:LytTR family DNA-binding domain-containing protein [Gammaproteobacteria bacterium]
MQGTARSLLIVDDEAPARERLERLVDDLSGWTSIGSCASGSEAIALVEKSRPSVVLLDIRMPGMSGIEVARHLVRLEQPPAVIFTTAYDQYALEAFDSRAVGYLLKPVRRERLESALAHAARMSDVVLSDLNLTTRGFARRRHLAVRVRDELRLIPLKDINYFRADQKYVTVHHTGGEHLIEDSLKQLEQEFPDLFLRIHRSMLVAVDAVEALEKDAAGGYHVRLRREGPTLAVSRRQVADLKSRLGSKR